MRIPVALAFALLLAPAARAGCPPDCVAGGGPSATDCFVAWSGLPGMTETCADGEACDIDGKVDGVCMLGLQGCINVPGLGACTPAGLSGPPTVKPSKDPTGQALASALAALDPAGSGCTPPGLALPLRLSLAGIKPGKARLTVTASSGGRRDRDKLRLTCTPGAAQPSFAQNVQPIFTVRCSRRSRGAALQRPRGSAARPRPRRPSVSAPALGLPAQLCYRTRGRQLPARIQRT